MRTNDSPVPAGTKARGSVSSYQLFFILALAILCSCDGGSGSSGGAFIINKESGQIDLCQLTASGNVDFANCKLASTTTFSQPIDMVMTGPSALISVEDGIEQCARDGGQLTSCRLAISDGDFPVGLTLADEVLFVADYSAKSIVNYSTADLTRLGSKSIPTSPTDVVFDQDVGYIVTQDIAGSVVLACDANLENCASVYNPLDRALLGMTISNGVAFVTDASGNSLISCDVQADGSFSGCSVQGDATIFNYPYGITIRNDVAYIPNRAETSVTVCDVSGKELLNCSKSTNDLLDGPTWVIFE